MQLEDKEFELQFMVFSDSENEIDETLDRPTRKFLLLLRQHFQKPVFASFSRDKVCIGISFRHDLLESSIHKNINRKNLERMAIMVCSMREMADFVSKYKS